MRTDREIEIDMEEEEVKIMDDDEISSYRVDEDEDGARHEISIKFPTLDSPTRYRLT